MSLVGFQAKAHPQQTAAGRNDSDADERYTPLSLFEPLHAVHRFSVDAAGCAAAPASARVGRFWTKAENGLEQSWDGERVWCNPPFSSLGPWVEKAWLGGAALVVMLIPGNRTEQPFWQRMIEPFRDREFGLRTHFLPSRISFGTPQFPQGKKWQSSAPFGCVLLVWGETDGWNRGAAKVHALKTQRSLFEVAP